MSAGPPRGLRRQEAREPPAAWQTACAASGVSSSGEGGPAATDGEGGVISGGGAAWTGVGGFSAVVAGGSVARGSAGGVASAGGGEFDGVRREVFSQRGGVFGVPHRSKEGAPPAARGTPPALRSWLGLARGRSRYYIDDHFLVALVPRGARYCRATKAVACRASTPAITAGRSQAVERQVLRKPSPQPSSLSWGRRRDRRGFVRAGDDGDAGDAVCRQRVQHETTSP